MKHPTRALAVVLALAAGALARPPVAHAQTSAAHADPLATFAAARSAFEADAHGAAAERMARFGDSPHQPGTDRLAATRARGELTRALAAQRAGLPEAEYLLERFVDRYSPQPLATEAVREVADLAFAQRDYARAATFYDRLPLAGLTPAERDRVRFRLGYTSFASMDFARAGRYLGDLRARPGVYQEPASYYYALTRFYQGDLDGARAGFELLADSERYAAVVPGNLAQLYFAQGDYERVIAYAMPVVDRAGVRQRDQIHLLIGRSFFELGRYEEALPHLEFYAEGAERLAAADFYQLGYAQYRTGHYEQASANLRQLAAEDSPLGQQALDYLGNAYLQLDQRAEARPAFLAVSRMAYDARLREEAAYNVAKLSYELGYDQEALAALQAIGPDSRYHAEAQALLSRVVLKSRDYARALDVLDGMDAPSPALRETRQQVRVLRGLQLLAAGEDDEAEALLSRSLTEASDAHYKALALYWLGDLAYRRGELTEAGRRLTAFQTAAQAVTEALPPDANPATASYLLGYVNLKAERYGVALGHFQEAVAGLRQRQRLVGEDPALARMLGDAVVRAGDANFKRNDYPAALRFYDEAVAERYPGHVYALYQKAIIEGLRGDETEKILALETIADNYPRSPFAEEALYELGVTYQGINQLNRAAQTLRRLVDERPGSPLRNEALLQLGLVSVNQGSIEPAIAYYKQVFANDPKASELRRAQDALQELYVDELGRPDDYFAFLETVPGLRLDATVRDSISYASARGQYQSGRYDRAVEQYGRYLAEFPRGGYAADALRERADAYLLLEQYPEALADFEALIQRGAGGRYYAEALRKAAQIAYDAERDFDKAYRYATRLLEEDGETTAEVVLLALRAAYRAGDEEAVFALAERLAAVEGAGEGMRAEAGFYLGRMAYDARDHDQALQAFNRVIRAAPEREIAAEARYLVARIYFLRRELDLAEAITVRAQRESSAYPDWVARSTLLLIDLYLERGDYLSARAVAEGLVANYRGDAELEREAERKLVEVTRAADGASRVAPVDTGVIELEAPAENPEPPRR